MDWTDWVAIGTGVASSIAAVAALFVAIATMGIQDRAIQDQRRAERHARRTERREFAASVDSFAMWYSERVIGDGAPDPGPTEALIPAAQALRLYASRLTQPGAERLAHWALDLLGRLYRGTSGMRPFEEMRVISATASLWVLDGDIDLDAAIGEADPAYEAKPL